MSNDEFQMKGFWDKKPTQSQVFKPNEIIGFLMVNGSWAVYLKEGVRRKRYVQNPEFENFTQINQELINYELWQKYYKVILGVDDFSHNIE